MIKIIAKQLLQFIEFASAKGKIKTCVIYVTQNEMKTKTSNITDGYDVSFISDVVLQGSMYDYNTTEEQIVIPIKDTKVIIDILKNYGEKEIKVSINNNYLVIDSGNSKAEITIASVDYIKNNVTKPLKFEFGYSELIAGTYLQKIYKNMSSLGSKYMFIKIENGLMEFITGDENFDKITESCETELENCTSKYDKLIGMAIDNLGSEITISLLDDGPIKFEGDEEGIVYKYYVMNAE